jgi:predicted O-methyltransferase YrrM
MSMQALQEFIGRHMVSAGALSAVCAALDAKASGAPMDPALERRIQEFLATLGAPDLLSDVGVQEAATMRSILRAMSMLDSKLLFASTRVRGWTYPEPELLQSIGEAARIHALSMTREVVPACEGLAGRFGKEGATMLDAGVGVAGTAIAMAQMWPELRIVGIDPWQPSLRLARENVDRANLAGRVELREQGVEALTDKSAFDAVWFATPFIPEQRARTGIEKSLEALRPGGWIVAGAHDDAGPPPLAALQRLRETQWGGPVWSVAETEAVLRKAGFVEVRGLPTQPGALASFVVGRRKPG